MLNILTFEPSIREAFNEMDQSNENFVSQSLPCDSPAPNLHEQPSLGQLGTLDHQSAPIEPAGVEQSLDSGAVPHLSPPLVGSQDVQYQTSSAATQGQVTNSCRPSPVPVIVLFVLNGAHLS